MKKKNTQVYKIIIIVVVIGLFAILYSQTSCKEGLEERAPQREAMAKVPLVEVTKTFYAGMYPNGSACPDDYKYDTKEDRCNLIVQDTIIQ
jgi:hypothetical protein